MANVYLMESTYQDLAERALRILDNSQKYRILILLIGAPGSGKTTIAKRVVDILNKQHQESGDVIVDDDTTGDEGSSVLEHFNDGLPKYDTDAVIDYEAEDYVPTIEKTEQDEVILRGRGGDSTSIKITNKKTKRDSDTFAQVIPMDGFHLPRSILEKFNDSETAFKRRGSPFTFDSSLIVKLVENLNETMKVPNYKNIAPLDIIIPKNEGVGAIPNIHIPDFNHSEHDPNQYGCEIHSSSRVLIMEGLYLLLDNPIWSQIAKSLNPNIESVHSTNDENSNKTTSRTEELIYNNINDIPIIPEGKNYDTWKILVDDEKMLKRVSKRHLNAKIVKSLKDGEERVKVNDLPNGAKIYRESFKSDLNIISIDDINEQ